MMEGLNISDDIYFDEKYIRLYLGVNEEYFEFKFVEKNNVFINRSIKRPISKIGDIKLGEEYYDLETAYGYGGFYVNSSDSGFISRAMEKYEEQCRKENIISEFIRFHPFSDFPEKGNKFLDLCLHNRNVIYLDLCKDPFLGYKKKVRSIVKKSTALVGVYESSNIDKFIELYNETMERNNAEDFYYFDEEYYRSLIELEGVRLYEVRHEDEVVAMSFFMFSKEVVHYHLSANSQGSYRLNANYALLHRLFEVAKNENKKYFVLGGGVSSSSEDSLFKFKKKFSSDMRPFYIGGKIYNNEVYKSYCDIWLNQSCKDISYFLKYRLKVV